LSARATVAIRKLESQLESSADELSSSHGGLGSLQEKKANDVDDLTAKLATTKSLLSTTTSNAFFS
jgi:hypothetical protein